MQKAPPVGGAFSLPQGVKSVVGVVAALVLGGVFHALELARELLQQLLLDPLFQGVIDHGATVATTAKLQDGQFVFGQLGQGHLAAVTGQHGVHLGDEGVLDTFDQRGIVGDLAHLGVGGLQGQLGTHLIGDEIDGGIHQEGGTQGIDHAVETAEGQVLIFRIDCIGRAIGDATLGILGSRIDHKHPDIGAVRLFFQQFTEMCLGGVGNADHHYPHKPECTTRVFMITRLSGLG